MRSANEARDAVPSPRKPEVEEPDLAAPEYYLNRELTWLSFNSRVLHEAEDKRTPLLERVKFLAIASNNLNEFFMKRIGGLKQQVGAGLSESTVDGRTPQQQIDECYAEVRRFGQRKQRVWKQLIRLLNRNGIEITRYAQLGEKQRTQLKAYYVDNIYPLVSPQAVDPAHPFPFISNLSLNLLVSLPASKKSTLPLVRIKVPIGSGIPRFLQVGKESVFVPIEDVMANNLDLLFPGIEGHSCEVFLVTRNANTEGDEDEADDLLGMIESELRERKFAPIVRLEVGEGISEKHRGMLAAELGLDEESDVFVVPGMLGMHHLMQIASIDIPTLHDKPHHPLDHPELPTNENIFHLIRRDGPFLLQHPYESFSTSVERFLREASEDPKVQAIKMTLYRTSEDSKVIRYLLGAARNGKQVAVSVELKARFDEEANIQWANKLEEAGIHVTYGVVGLKTHSKVVLVLRQDYSGLRRYAHVGTGNYHAGTARIYSDLGLLTCDEQIGQDLTEFFNYLTTGYKPNRSYKKILTAPRHLKKSLLEKIDREIEHQASGTPGSIQIKCNALEDTEVTRALYRASQAGVQVDMVVRDSCRLRPGLPGLSENVRVVSIVGRFLEHTRIFHFRNAGDDEYFIGSADCMKRNLESRVEVVVPIETRSLRKELQAFLDTQLEDQRSAWVMESNGSYTQRLSGRGRKAKGSHRILIERAEKRQKKAGRTQLKATDAKKTPGGKQHQ
ncbi:MAG: polyphosphate kinase 1 [Deltaproteobacteria bacterium]|nr:polyphosphate kinase 1 [Deltaproteobacteria bacterium]MBW2417807.1 polyphosphate kinase 1 [Deltaproteobacteria bacterium]